MMSPGMAVMAQSPTGLGPSTMFPSVASVTRPMNQPISSIAPSSSSLFPSLSSIEPTSKQQDVTLTNNVQTITNEMSLLDLDLSLYPSAPSIDVAKPLSSHPPSSFLNSGNSIDLTSEEPPFISYKENSDKDLISEFSPTASKNKGPKSLKTGKELANESLVDDLFGNFQSVNKSEPKSLNDDEEFDDFKSADFTPFTFLEVKEKPPEDNLGKHGNFPISPAV